MYVLHHTFPYKVIVPHAAVFCSSQGSPFLLKHQWQSHMIRARHTCLSWSDRDQVYPQYRAWRHSMHLRCLPRRALGKWNDPFRGSPSFSQSLVSVSSKAELPLLQHCRGGGEGVRYGSERTFASTCTLCCPKVRTVRCHTSLFLLYQ
jgi:hypothetical protein